MYAYIKGTVEAVEADRVIIENNNIGYNVYVPSGVMAGIGCIGQEVKLYTHLNVKEDAMTLFGFLTREDLELFRLLITVSGIGPKGAMGILGTLSADDLRFAIMAGDSKAISSAPGIGAKTAQKIIIELKDKLKPEDITSVSAAAPLSGMSDTESDIVTDAAMALTALGYSQTDAMRAIRKCDISAEATAEELIKAALKKMA